MRAPAVVAVTAPIMSRLTFQFAFQPAEVFSFYLKLLVTCSRLEATLWTPFWDGFSVYVNWMVFNSQRGSRTSQGLLECVIPPLFLQESCFYRLKRLNYTRQSGFIVNSCSMDAGVFINDRNEQVDHSEVNFIC